MSMNNQSSDYIQTGINQEKYSSYRQMVKDIEFVQQLAHPLYVLQLVNRGYFLNQQFRSYLHGLKYLYRPQFIKLVRYPQGFYNLQLMQQKGFPEKMKDQKNREKFIIDCLNRNQQIQKGFVN